MEAICIYCFYHGYVLYVSFLPLANARGKTRDINVPVVKTIHTYGFHELFLNQSGNVEIYIFDNTNRKAAHSKFDTYLI